MIASFHIIEYRRRAFVPPKPSAEQTPGLRFWRPLNIGGDFAYYRQHPSRWALYPRLKPDFRRWAFYAVWDDESAVDEFVANSDTGRRWSDSTTDACHLWLRPNHVCGPWPGVQILRGSETKPPTDLSVAYLTRTDLSLRGTLAMWGSAAPGLLRHIPDSDELLLGLPLVDRPYTQPVAFSVWRNAASARHFTHDIAGHREAVQRVRRADHDLIPRFSSALFEPYRCKGAWKGRNPLGLPGQRAPEQPTTPGRQPSDP